MTSKITKIPLNTQNDPNTFREFWSNASLSKPNPHRPFLSSSSPPPTFLHQRLSLHHNNNNPYRHLLIAFSIVNDAVSFPGGDDNNDNNKNGNSGGGGRGGEGGDEGSSAEDKNREEALMVLAKAGRSLKNFTKDLAAAIEVFLSWRSRRCCGGWCSLVGSRRGYWLMISSLLRSSWNAALGICGFFFFFFEEILPVYLILNFRWV